MCWRAILVVGAVVSSLTAGAFAADELGVDLKIAPWLLTELQRRPNASMLVVLKDQAPPQDQDSLTPQEQFARLSRLAAGTQRELRAWLEARQIKVTPYWIVNAILIETDLAIARTIAARADVERLVGNPRVWALPAVTRNEAGPGSDGTEWGINMVRAPDVWSQYGKRGEGVVVATCDTGVEWDHPALQAHYRGWDSASGTADHRYSWHDAIEDLATPIDDHDHGTHVTGTMVGDDNQGNQIGVAPAAKFIGCRNMDHGVGQPSTYLHCLEWSLAPYPPGGDKFRDARPEFAPHVVNNSWGCPPSEGCDTQILLSAFTRQRESGILQIAAAGNSGPSCSTVSDPPAIYDEVFSIGAVDSTRGIALFSSRGPVTIDGSNRRKPNGAAPGDGVRSSVRGGGYATFSGTSMASPHAAGVAALLMSVRPNLRSVINPLRCMLEQSATHNVGSMTPQTCGGTRHNQYPNNTSGHGLITALGALQLADGDADAVANACDCAPTNGGVFVAPNRVRELAISANSHQRWAWRSQAGSAGSATRYDLLRGDVGALQSSGSIAAAACRANDLTTPSFDDADLPAPGAAFYYLARAQNSCGTSDYGANSGGTVRQNSSCL
jgi:subtilisin family serine protease